MRMVGINKKRMVGVQYLAQSTADKKSVVAAPGITMCASDEAVAGPLCTGRQRAS